MYATFKYNQTGVSAARRFFDREIGYFYTANVVLEPSQKSGLNTEKCHYWHCVRVSLSGLHETFSIRLDLNSVTKQ